MRLPVLYRYMCVSRLPRGVFLPRIPLACSASSILMEVPRIAVCPSCARWVHRCACPNRDIVHRTSSVAYLVRAVDEGWSPAISRRILRTAHRWVRRCFSAWTGYTLHAKRSAVLAAQDALSRMQRMYADAAFVEARAFTEYMVLCRAIANCEDEVREARRYCGLDRPRSRSLIPGELAVSGSQRTTIGRAARGRCSPRPASRSHRTELRPIWPVGHSRRIARRVQRRARWPPSRAARRSWPSALCASG
jgi:hypothetical protein